MREVRSRRDYLDRWSPQNPLRDPYLCEVYDSDQELPARRRYPALEAISGEECQYTLVRAIVDPEAVVLEFFD